MTGPEIIRMILCLTGYDKNVSVRTYRGEGLAQGYEIHAENENGDSFYDINCEGLPFMIWQILERYKEQDNCYDSSWWNVPSYVFKSDESVNSLREAWDKRKKEQDEINKRNQPLCDWLQQNNPCSEDCDMNEHDNEWDSIHYHCQKCHTNNCPRLKKFNEDYDTFRKEFATQNKL